MTNKYEELRELVYKIIYPNGIPFEEGCEVIICTCSHDDVCQKYKLIDDYCNVYESDECRFISAEEYCSDDEILTCPGYEIDPDNNLGKPLSLQDILLALRTKSSFISINTDGTLVPSSVCIDLTLPISEQSLEVLGGLINLLK